MVNIKIKDDAIDAVEIRELLILFQVVSRPPRLVLPPDHHHHTTRRRCAVFLWEMRQR